MIKTTAARQGKTWKVVALPSRCIMEVCRFAERFRQPTRVAASTFGFTLLLLALLIVVAITFNQYGFTTDERLGFQRASNIYEFLASGAKNTQSVSRFDVFSIYGAMPDVIALALQKCVPELSFDSRHFISALFGVVGVYYLYRLTAVFIGAETGLIAAVLLICNPMWFGYMFFNLKDIPFATTLLASSFYGLVGLTGQPKPWSVSLRFGVSLGLLAATKVIGPLILGFVLLVSLAFLYVTPGVQRVVNGKALLVRLLIGVISGAAGCLLGFFFFWPQFFFFSISELGSVIEKFLNFKEWHIKVLLGGSYYPSDDVPWYYTITYIIISMPLTHLSLTAVGFVLGICRRQPMVMAATVICLGTLSEQALTGAVAFNGYRHFLFLVPFLALVSAYPLGLLIEIERHQFLRFAAMMTVLLALTATILEMYRLFPYQYSYYNMIVGGLSGADGKYYIDVWRSAFREALDAVERIDGRPEIRIFSCGEIITWEHPRIRVVTDLLHADYVVLVRHNCNMDAARNWATVAEVRRVGVLFARIYTAKTNQLE